MHRKINMTEGPLFSRMVVFIIPMIITNLLQQLYHMADMIIAGRFAGDDALAAIGATGHLTGLFSNVFIGIAIGTSAVLAQVIGANLKDKISDVVHTSIAFALIIGSIFAVAGIVFCKPLLILLNTPQDILNKSALYMRIIFAGYPIVSLYIFSGAILRAKGDTVRPLIFSAISGITNVSLNCLFVIGFGMGVEGVAIPTLISQTISAVLVVITLLKEDVEIRLDIKKLRIHKNELKKILSIGIPMGIQSTMVSISNVIIQSAINSFGSIAVAGAAVANNINTLFYTILNTCSHASTIFCGQNYGAGKYRRLAKSLVYSCVIATIIAVISGFGFFAFQNEILGFFSKSKEVIAYGLQIATLLAATYFLDGIMESIIGALRAINRATSTMIIYIFGLCGVRIIWIYTYFQSHKSLRVLYYSYPLSWAILLVASLLLFIFYFRKINKRISI